MKNVEYYMNLDTKKDIPQDKKALAELMLETYQLQKDLRKQANKAGAIYKACNEKLLGIL